MRSLRNWAEAAKRRRPCTSVLKRRKNRGKVPYGGVIRTCCLEGKGGSLKGREWLTSRHWRGVGVDAEKQQPDWSFEGEQFGQPWTSKPDCRGLINQVEKEAEAERADESLKMSSCRGGEKMGCRATRLRGPTTVSLYNSRSFILIWRHFPTL